MAILIHMSSWSWVGIDGGICAQVSQELVWKSIWRGELHGQDCPWEDNTGRGNRQGAKAKGVLRFFIPVRESSCFAILHCYLEMVIWYVPLQSLLLQGEELIHLDGKCCPECISKNGYCVHEENAEFVSISLMTGDY